MLAHSKLSLEEHVDACMSSAVSQPFSLSLPPYALLISEPLAFRSSSPAHMANCYIARMIRRLYREIVLATFATFATVHVLRNSGILITL